MEKKKQIRKILVLKMLFLLAVLGVIVKVFYGNYKDILAQLKELTMASFALLLFCSIFYNIIEGLCYYTMGRRYHKKFRIRDGIGCSYYCAFFKLSTLGSGTAISGMYYLNEYRVPPAKSFGMITVNYMLQKVGVAIFCILGFITHIPEMERYYHKYFMFVVFGIIATAFVAIGLLILILWEKLHNFVISFGLKIFKNQKITEKINMLSEYLSNVRSESGEMVKDKAFMSKLLALNVLKYIGWYSIPCVILKYDTPEKIFLGVSIMALASALISVIPSPGAVGSTEGMVYVMFLSVSNDVKAFTIMLLYRCFTYIVPFLIGGIFIVIKKMISVVKNKKIGYNGTI